jgi:hypothetical protein
VKVFSSSIQQFTSQALYLVSHKMPAHSFPSYRSNNNRRRSILFLLLSAAGSLTLASCGGGGSHSTLAGTATRSEETPIAYALKIAPGTEIADVMRNSGATVVDSIPGTGLYRIQVTPGNATPVTARLKADHRVRGLEPDDSIASPEGGDLVEGDPIHVPFDFVSPRSISFQTVYALFESPSAGSVNPDADQQVNLGNVPVSTRGNGTIVAVLDTGIEAEHPSLAGHLVGGYNTLSPDAAPSDSADGVTNQAVGHGTMVAGIITRLAPEAKIMPIRVLNGDGRGSLINTIRGIRYAVENGANILNLSLGSTTSSSLLDEAVREAQLAGCIVVAAAGNSGTNTMQYPAASAGVLSVAALDRGNVRASFSNYGGYVNLAAPGVAIRSTYVGGGYASWSGTSFAAPFVSATAALTRSAYPDWTADQIRRQIWQTATSINSTNTGVAGQLGKGVLNISRALGLSMAVPSRPE